MHRFFLGIYAAVIAVNCLSAATPPVSSRNVPVSSATDTNSPAAIELQQLMEDDDTALAEVDQWIRDNDAFVAKGAGQSKDELNKRIRARLETIRNRYQDFLKRYPDDARGHLAYGTFLGDIGDETLAASEYEISRKLDPTNPAVWNNLANYYGEYSPITNAFAYYAKAIELDPSEPVYYQNLATTVYLFRKDAREFYHIDEPQVFDKSLDLYRKAMRLDPTNFTLASDYAESYYGIKPLRTNDALMSWTNVLKIAQDDIEREGVYIHLARLKMAVGRFAEVRQHLDAVTNEFYRTIRQRLERNLAEREHPSTNAVDAVTNTIVSTNAAIAPAPEK